MTAEASPSAHRPVDPSAAIPPVASVLVPFCFWYLPGEAGHECEPAAASAVVASPPDLRASAADAPGSGRAAPPAEPLGAVASEPVAGSTAAAPFVVEAAPGEGTVGAGTARSAVVPAGDGALVRCAPDPQLLCSAIAIHLAAQGRPGSQPLRWAITAVEATRGLQLEGIAVAAWAFSARSA